MTEPSNDATPRATDQNTRPNTRSNSSPEPRPNTRRDFLRSLIGKTGELAVGEANRRLEQAARRFVRPPGAVPEAEFLASCTRCGDCITACPEEALFMLGPHLGLAVETPALDLINKACALCADYPCIAACEPQALRPLDGVLPRFATLRIEAGRCLPFQGPECGVCVAVCPVEGAITLEGTLPRIDGDHCAGCALCRRACIVLPPAISVHPLAKA